MASSVPSEQQPANPPRNSDQVSRDIHLHQPILNSPSARKRPPPDRHLQTHQHRLNPHQRTPLHTTLHAHHSPLLVLHGTAPDPRHRRQRQPTRHRNPVPPPLGRGPTPAHRHHRTFDQVLPHAHGRRVPGVSACGWGTGCSSSGAGVFGPSS